MKWRVEFDNHEIRARFDAVIWTDDNQVVARIPQADPAWSDEANAKVETNALVMAAGPELLAALESVIAEIGPDWDDSWSSWVHEAAIAAIAKAEGGAS